MPAQISNDPNSTPSVTPDEVEALNPQAVAFHCTMANLGDEPGDTTGWYWTVDGPDGSIRHSEFIKDNTLEPGATFETGANLERDFVTSLEPGTFWVSLRNPNGDTTASASLLIKELALSVSDRAGSRCARGNHRSLHRVHPGSDPMVRPARS